MKKGFTLIELLAVIVILAIIAVIAVPIVLNIINDSKESAVLRSADFYLNGVETSIASAVLKNIKTEDGTYSIMQDGNLCIGTLENNTCTGDILKIEMDGEVPTEGTITIKDGEIYKTEIILSDKEIWIDPFTNKLDYKLAPGLYDKNDKLLLSWDELNEKALELTEEDIDFDGIIRDSRGYSAEIIIDAIDNAYKLVIDESITAIGDWAFSGVENLAIIIIPDGVTSIGYVAFEVVPESTSNLQKINIPSSVKTIGENAFVDNKNLTTVIIEEGIESIEFNAFLGCINLTSITIPSTVKNIGSMAFADTGLTSIRIPNGEITELSQTFQGCHNLREVIIGEGVTAIHSGAFNDCPSLVSVKLPTTLTSISAEAFMGCTSLKEITIPDLVTEITEDVFLDCESLTTIYYKGAAEGFPWGAPNAKLETNF